MDLVLNFINNNYVWLLIVFIIILMALIGYIAENQGNLKQEKKKNTLESDSYRKKDIEKSNSNEALEESIDYNENQENINDFEIDSNIDELDLKEEVKEEPIEEDMSDKKDLEEDIADNKTKEENISDEKNSEDPIEEDLYAPLGNKEFNRDLNIDKDFNNILDDVEETAEEADIELPKLNETDEESLETDEEDIWKF
jgi:hypothetical protein